ncbi:MAG: hypothetical protein IPM32_09585 [Ignavibacteriae bacterium]|nr:hypothetical protein [Ignavibacteriota bacterium]
MIELDKIDFSKIILLTGKNNFFGQTRKPWVSMDTQKINKQLIENDFKVETYEFQKVVNNNIEIINSIIFYTFSQNENVRNYIKDLIYHLSKFNNLIIPSYDLLLCHENKGYQELYRKQLYLDSLKSFYFNDKSEIDFSQLFYPIVLKHVNGSNGKNVFLVNNKEELKTKLDKFEKIGIFTKLDLLRRKYFRKKKHYKLYPNYSNEIDYIEYKEYVTERDNFILQEFIPNLKADYRVLIIYDKYFITKRHNRDNDFRASGAKKFDFNFEVNKDLLSYAKSFYEKFDSPFLSIDICESNNKFYTFEFQALHFGINVFVYSKGYYYYKNNEWNFVDNKNSIENEIVYGLTKFINSKKAN